MRYDFFVDEDKRNRRLGILAVPNAVALGQVLGNVKDQYSMSREIKWNEIDRYRLPVAVSWVRIAIWFRGLKFTTLEWPKGGSKGDILVTFFQDFLQGNGTILYGTTFDSVAFLDFDAIDKRGNLHEFIARHTQILRCYPLDSKANPCLQLVDILLGAFVRTSGRPQIIPSPIYKRWPSIDSQLQAHKRLAAPDFADSESKIYLAGYVSRKFDRILVT